MQLLNQLIEILFASGRTDESDKYMKLFSKRERRKEISKLYPIF